MSGADDSYAAIVIGAGAAGLMAGIRAAQRGVKVLIVEKNRKPGVKILMSGGTRCNITQNTDNRGIINAYGKPGRFLHSPLAALSVADSIAFFNAAGVETKVEPTGKIFPASDRALDVLQALLQQVEASGCELALAEPVERIERGSEGFEITTAKRVLHSPKVILTTGGKSFPGCGTTGDGYAWAAALGHTIVPTRPALVPILCEEPWVRSLQGITLPDVQLRVVEALANAAGEPVPSGKRNALAERRGSLLFTHFGLSGPVALDVSRAVTGHARPRDLALLCDLLPDLPRPALEQHLQQQAAAAGKKQVLSLLPEALPRRMAEALLARAEIPLERKAAELSKRDRATIVNLCKELPLRVAGTLGFEKAEVTAGGVALEEVDSRTMQSKLAHGLYLAGEILDLDGPIGGFNFQAAWSTGWLAGELRG